jgi:glycyl-tRNA synthetase beta chain
MSSVEQTIYSPIRPLNRELLLELLSEEIPARMQREAIGALTGLIHRKLAAAQIPTQELNYFVTPRRLTVIGEIPERQPERTEERRGPRAGAPKAALDGFLRAAGLHSLEECEIRDVGRGEFYFAVLRHPGRATAVVLPELLRAAIHELPWPKSMRFPAASLRWVRPLTSVICLFDGTVLPLALDGIPVGRTTRGHRFLSKGEIAVDNADDYRDRLKAACVVLGQEDRHNKIETDLHGLAAAEGLAVKPDLALLDEVAGLVEFPVVLMGAIDDRSMELPPEVLAAAMRTHQRYFSCLNPDGTLASRFLFVADNRAEDDGKRIIAGNERVLRARLADARFFWDQDRRVTLQSRVQALVQRVFHAKLGSVRSKVARMEQLAVFLAPFVPGADVEPSQRSVRLAKADLSTAMVGEFPELQGIMGRYYALSDNEDPAVADAVADHYRPLGPNDVVPTAPLSIVAALADKIDSLVSFFAIGEKPTGSRDPFALRRAAQGVIRIILENNLRVPLRSVFMAAAGVVPVDYQKIMEEQNIVGELLAFITDRLKVYLREQGVRHDLIAAVFALGEDDLVRLLARVRAIERFLTWDDGANLLVAYRRAVNIVAIEEKRDGRAYNDPVDRNILRELQEKQLSAALDVLNELPNRSFVVGGTTEDFSRAMTALASLRQPVDAFFDKVTVNTEEPRLRENRLRLLSAIRATMNRVADFSQIEG